MTVLYVSSECVYVYYTFKIPESNVNPGKGAHEDRPAAVKRLAPGHLPYLLNVAGLLAGEMEGKKRGDVLGFKAGVLRGPSVQTALDGLRVAFERRLAPACVAVGVGDFDKEPSRGNAEIFNGCNLGHFVAC